MPLAVPAPTSAQFVVGDVVTLRRPCLGNPAGARAVVVEIYDLGDGPSPSLLFENGAHDGFSARDLELFGVRYAGHDAAVEGYEFRNAVALYQDWRAGRFASVWRAA